MGLGGDEFPDYAETSGPQGGDSGHFKTFQSLDAYQVHDNTIHFSDEERLVGVGQVGVEQALQAGRLAGGLKAVRALSCMECSGFDA